MPESINSQKILIVEGRDDMNFYKELLNHLNINDIQIIPVNGKDQFDSKIAALILTTGFSQVRTIGIIRDADTTAGGAFESICRLLTKHHLPHPTVSGEVINQERIRVGVYIAPDNQNIGAIEDLILLSVNHLDSIRCINAFFQCANIQEPVNSKAMVQAYLALKNPLANNIGYAALQNHWDWGHACFEGIKTFLSEL